MARAPQPVDAHLDRDPLAPQVRRPIEVGGLLRAREAQASRQGDLRARAGIGRSARVAVGVGHHTLAGRPAGGQLKLAREPNCVGRGALKQEGARV